MKKTTFTALIIAAAILLAAAKAQTRTENAAHFLTPGEYCEYIYALEDYVELLEAELYRLSERDTADYMGDIVMETDQYANYQDAIEKFYNLPNKED